MNQKVIVQRKTPLKIPGITSKERLFKSTNFKIGFGYFLIAITGAISFYYAKKDVNENRLNNMQIKEDITKAKTGHSERFKFVSDKNTQFEDNERKKINNNKKFKLLIGLTGSVASIKLPNALDNFKKLLPNIDICLISTKSALHFVNINELNEIKCLNERLNYILLDSTKQTITNKESTVIITFSDEDEWSSWSKRNDPVLHIELRKWADLFLIMPLDANTLAKLSNGICDNLLTCVARAWDFKKPIIICPAMNTHMYEHVITEQQLNTLKSWGYKIIDAIEKLLMCGDYGKGAMAEIDVIVNTTVDILLNMNKTK